MAEEETDCSRPPAAHSMQGTAPFAAAAAHLRAANWWHARPRAPKLRLRRCRRAEGCGLQGRLRRCRLHGGRGRRPWCASPWSRLHVKWDRDTCVFLWTQQGIGQAKALQAAACARCRQPAGKLTPPMAIGAPGAVTAGQGGTGRRVISSAARLQLWRRQALLEGGWRGHLPPCCFIQAGRTDSRPLPAILQLFYLPEETGGHGLLLDVLHMPGQAPRTLVLWKY